MPSKHITEFPVRNVLNPVLVRERYPVDVCRRCVAMPMQWGEAICSCGWYITYWLVVSNIFYFHAYLGKWSNFTNMFQMGWNHQPVTYIWDRFPKFSSKTFLLVTRSITWVFLPTSLRVAKSKARCRCVTKQPASGWNNMTPMGRVPRGRWGFLHRSKQEILEKHEDKKRLAMNCHGVCVFQGCVVPFLDFCSFCWSVSIGPTSKENSHESRAWPMAWMMREI